MTRSKFSGNNGQIQLWQFLLELLTDKDCREVIQWLGDEGEFKVSRSPAFAFLDTETFQDTVSFVSVCGTPSSFIELDLEGRRCY